MDPTHWHQSPVAGSPLIQLASGTAVVRMASTGHSVSASASQRLLPRGIVRFRRPKVQGIVAERKTHSRVLSGDEVQPVEVESSPQHRLLAWRPCPFCGHR